MAVNPRVAEREALDNNKRAVGDEGGDGASVLQKFLREQWDVSLFGAGARAIGSAIGSGFSAADQATVSAVPSWQAANVTAAAVRGGASTEEAQAAGEAARTGVEQEQEEDKRRVGMTPGMLQKTLGAVNYAYSQGVSRPVSTAFLATDPGAAIYDDGVQPSDIRRAWERSAQVSPARASAASPINFASRLLGFDNYDVWSDTDMEAADENPFYNFFTGVGDAALQVAPLGARGPRLSMLRKAGIRSQRGILSADDISTLRREYDEHRQWRNSQTSPAPTIEVDTDGNPRLTDPSLPEWERFPSIDDLRAADQPKGRQTGVGFLVDNIARETDPAKILESPLLTGVSGVDKVKLSSIYARTDDPDTVFTLYMAGKGDFQALQDLAERAPQHIWNLAEMDSVVYNNYLDGIPFRPQPGDELNLVNQVFDSALDRDQYFLDVQRTFIDTVDGSPRMGDMTMANSLWVERIRDASGRMRYAFKTGDYTGAPGWVRKTVEGPLGGPTTQFIAWVGGRQPLGRVSRSGARPNDIIQELDAWFGSVPIFRGAKRELKVGTDKDGNPVMMPVQQYVAEQKARLLQAQVDGNLEGAWREMENDAIMVMGMTMGYDARAAADIIKKADDMRGEAQAVTDYLQSTGGYLFSENQRVIYDSAATLSMLLDSFATTSLRDVYYYAKQNLPERSAAAKFGTWLPRAGAQGFDEVMKFFRTNVLLDLGYIPKNSIGEPWVASAIAHGTVLSDEGFRATMGNFGRNRVNELKRAAYAAELKTRVDKLLGGKKKAKTRKDLRIEINNLILQREDALATIDTMQADLDAVKGGVVPPSQSPKVAARARATMFEAHQIIRSIEASLDNTVPEWRQVVEPATSARVSEQLRFYRAVLGEDADYLNDLRDELGSIYARSYEKTIRPSQRVQRQIDALDAQIADIDAALQKFGTDYRTPDIDVSGVSVTGAGAQIDWANAKINRDFLAAQVRDAERAKVDISQPAANVDSAVLQYRAQVLLDENGDLAVTRTPDDQLVINFSDVPTYQKYMERFYPGVDNYSMVTLYRRAESTEDVFSPNATWSLNPSEVSGTGQLVSIDMPFNQVSRLSKGRTRFVPGRDQFVDLVPQRIPEEYRRSVRRLTDPELSPNVSGYAAWQQLAERNTGQVADVVRLEGNAARGRDYQAIALQRQRTSLVSQRDRLSEEMDKIVQQGVDAFADFRMPVGDKARADYLEARIARLEALRDSGKADQIRPMLDRLQAEYDEYLRSVDREVDVSAEKRDAMIKRVEELDQELSALQIQLGVKEAKLDSVRGDRILFGTGRGDMTFNIGGEKFTVPGPLADDQYALGSGWRAEVSAAQTTRLNYDPSFKAGGLTSRLRDAGEVEIIDRFDPRYFDELAYVVNVHFRNDQLIGQILEGKTKAELIAWLRTPKGKQYQEALGKDYLTNVEVRSEPMRALNSDKTVRMLLESASTLDEIWDIVNAYLPTEQVRKFVADRRTTGDFPLQGRSVGVTGAELKTLLAGEENLSRILSARGVWETFGNSKSRFREAGAMYNRALDFLWRWAMTEPETRLARNPFFTREFRRQMDTRIRVIQQQAEARGIKMTTAQWNNQLEAIRQSARRDALAEMEKTFYNIRRYSDPVYAARFLTAFPGAVFNSLYRYGRFAWREPERVLVGALALGDAISVLGVDAEGNPVGEENIADAVYLLVPGTKRSEKDTGQQIPIGSVASMFVDLPQLSWLGNFTVSSIVAQNPMNDERFRKAFDRLGLGWYYEDLFPYGPSPNPASGLFGAYQKELWRWARGMSDTDFIMSAVQFYANAMAEWEKNGYQGEAPTFEDAISDTRAYYFARIEELGPVKFPVPNLGSRAITKFVSPTSVKSAPPGQLMRDAWFEHREQYPDDTAEARRTFMEKYGDWARWYTYSSSEMVTYMPASMGMYERVWQKYPDLVQEMVSTAGTDEAMKYIGLLALDVDETFNPTVNNYLKNNPLPGDDVPVSRRITPQRFANIVAVEDGWRLFNQYSVQYEAELARLRELRDNAQTTEQQDHYRNQIYATEQEWRNWQRTGPLGQNKAWQNDRSTNQDRAVVASNFLRMIVENPKFAADEGKTEFWKQVKRFIDAEDQAWVALQKMRKNEDKANYRAEIRAWFNDNIFTEAPELKTVFERYFRSRWDPNDESMEGGVN